MKLVSTSDVTGAVCLVRMILLCNACIYAFDLLPQRSERWICWSYISVFLFMRIQYFRHITVFILLQRTRGPQNDCAWGPRKVLIRHWSDRRLWNAMLAGYLLLLGNETVSPLLAQTYLLRIHSSSSVPLHGLKVRVWGAVRAWRIVGPASFWRNREFLTLCIIKSDSFFFCQLTED
jgi:hypothetical protein